jgi:hypothetical protein
MMNGLPLVSRVDERSSFRDLGADIRRSDFGIRVTISLSATGGYGVLSVRLAA